MIRNISSSKVVVACLVLAVSFLYLRNLLYVDTPALQPKELQAPKGEPTEPQTTLLPFDKAPLYIADSQTNSHSARPSQLSIRVPPCS